jgi:putative membrane protein
MLAMLATTAMQNRSWCPMCGRMGGAVMFLWGLFWLVVLVAIVLLVVRLLSRGRASLDSPRGPSSHDDAEEILSARYARGEIDQATYQRMLDDIRRSRSP